MLKKYQELTFLVGEFVGLFVGDISRTADTTACQVRLLSFIVIEEKASEEAERTVIKELSAILDLNVSWTVL